MRFASTWAVVWSAVMLGGCGPGAIDVDFGDAGGNGDAGGSDEASSGASTSASTGGTASSGAPDPTDDGGSEPPDPSGGPVPGDTGEPDPSDSGSGPLDIFDPPPPDGLPDGSTCTQDLECLSGSCYLTPLIGGYCGECNEDADCPAGGCNTPDPFDGIGPTCNDGELGGGCETDAVCQPGLTCANVFDLLGIVQVNGCSECQTDGDCSPGAICTPVTSFSELGGARQCLAPGSLEPDSYCELEGAGDAQCATGICSVVDIMGLAQIGSCGDCNSDADCPGGATCVAGVFDLDSGALTGSTCQ